LVKARSYGNLDQTKAKSYGNVDQTKAESYRNVDQAKARRCIEIRNKEKLGTMEL
jgi:hypothetical protein